MKLNNKNKGFTLIELLVVIAVIGILSGVVLNSLQSARQKARNAQRLSDVQQIQNAMEVYATASGTNKLPKDTTAPGVWYCLGKTTSTAPTSNYANAQTGATGVWCSTGGSGPGFSSSVNAQLAQGIPQIPRNPNYAQTDARSYYRYHSGINVGPSSSPAGAYLVWSMEGTSANCGKGTRVYNGTTGDPHSTCALRLADKQ